MKPADIADVLVLLVVFNAPYRLQLAAAFSKCGLETIEARDPTHVEHVGLVLPARHPCRPSNNHAEAGDADALVVDFCFPDEKGEPTAAESAELARRFRSFDRPVVVLSDSPAEPEAKADIFADAGFPPDCLVCDTVESDIDEIAGLVARRVRGES